MVSYILIPEYKRLDFRVLDESSDEQSLLVIGVGLGRTGTMSLRKALQILYDKPCYHMYEVITRHRDHVTEWTEIFEQCRKTSVDNIDPRKLKRLFKGYAFTDGNPACAVYEKLIEIYPEAKVILTTRDSQQWLDSYRKTIARGLIESQDNQWEKLVDRFLLGLGFRDMALTSMQCALGWNLDFADDEAVKQAYEKRNHDIMARVPPERLLCFDIKQGWEPLCQFLNEPIPNVSFPRLNDREEMQDRIMKMYCLRKFICWGIPMMLIIVLIVAHFCNQNMN